MPEPEAKQEITIGVDGRPLMVFIELLKFRLKAGDLPFNISELPSKLARIEMDKSAAGTSEIHMTFYPSDSFLRFAAAVVTGDGKLEIIEKTGHGEPPPGE